MGRVRINLNVDMGESFGRWRLGDDAALLPLVPTVNVACGFHGGDPHVMRETVALAVAHGAEIGAHVGFPDLVGFGRRPMALSPGEVGDCATYQLGALAAFACAAGARLTHVKPHGSLYGMCSTSPEHGRALVDAVRDFDPALPIIVGGAAAREHADGRGMRVTAEAYVDLDYSDDAQPVIERAKRAHDPAAVAARAVAVALEGRASSVTGKSLAVDARTICLHGDAPNAVEVARAVRRALAGAGVDIVPLRAVLELDDNQHHHQRKADLCPPSVPWS